MHSSLAPPLENLLRGHCNHLPQHRQRGQLEPQWNLKAKRQAFKSM